MAITDKLKSIGNSIRAKTGKTQLIPLSTMAEEVENVYETGKEEIINFFRSSSDWSYFFYYDARTEFLPFFDENITANGEFFEYMFFHGGQVNPFVEFPASLNTSLGIAFNGMFKDCWIQKLPLIDTKNAREMNEMFYNSSVVETIPKLDFSCCTAADNIFIGCNNLKNITIEPRSINISGLDFSDCTKLTKESLTSIMYGLNPDIGDEYVEGKYTLTLSEAAISKAFETIEGGNDGLYTQEWDDLMYGFHYKGDGWFWDIWII